MYTNWIEDTQRPFFTDLNENQLDVATNDGDTIHVGKKKLFDFIRFL